MTLDSSGGAIGTRPRINEDGHDVPCAPCELRDEHAENRYHVAMRGTCDVLVGLHNDEFHCSVSGGSARRRCDTGGIRGAGAARDGENRGVLQ